VPETLQGLEVRTANSISVPRTEYCRNRTRRCDVAINHFQKSEEEMTARTENDRNKKKETLRARVTLAGSVSQDLR